MGPRALNEPAVSALRERLAGEVILPDDPRYEQARTVFNAMIDRRPAAIARCTSLEDVQAAVRFGREHELLTSVRAGGHSVAGTSVCDDGLVVDVRPMNAVSVDPDQRVARVGAGCTWADFDRAAQEHGLATTGGRVSTTGVAGLTLGGGSGWLERKHGLACDNLLSVELVTADGERVRAGEDENPELFWALHGGGGNFGVATEFEFQLHPVGPTVLAGLMLWEASRGPEVLALFRDVMRDAPEDLGTAFGYVTGADEPEVPEHLRGRRAALVAVCWIGDGADGEEVIRPFRELGPPDVDMVGPCAYSDFQCSIDDPPGYQNYWTADYLNEMSDDALATIVAYSEAMPVPSPAQSFIVPWGGAVAAADPADTPLTKRDAAFVVHPFALWQDPRESELYIGWARAFSADMKRFATGGVYLNFIGEEGDDRIVSAFGLENYERLARVKARYDPDNFFHLNQNIKPAALAATE